MTDKVYVTNMSSSMTGFSVPDKHWSKTWPRKGAKFLVEKDIIREAMYQYGVEYLFRNGILFIDDLDFKKELGLEAEDATPTTLETVALDDNYLNRITRLMPLKEAESAIEKLSDNQRKELFDYAVKHSDQLEMTRIDMISKTCKADLLKAIQLKKQMEE